MKFFATLFSFFVLTCVFSQNIIGLTDFYIFKGLKFYPTIPTETGGHLAVNYKQIGAFHYQPVLQRFENNRLQNELSIPLISGFEAEVDKDFFLLGGKPVILTQAQERNKFDFHVYSSSPDLDVVHGPIQILTVHKEQFESLELKRVSSSDEQFFAICVILENGQKGTLTLHYTVMNQDVEKVSDGVVVLPFISARTVLDHLALSNNGRLMSGFKMYNVNVDKSWYGRAALETYAVYDFGRTEKNIYTIQLDSGRVMDAKFEFTETENIVVSGTWENSKTKKFGLFGMQLNPEKNTISGQFHQELHTWPEVQTDLIYHGFEEQAINLRIKNIEMMNRFIVREIVEAQNGFVVLLEEAYFSGAVKERSTGAYLDFRYFHNNHIVAMKFDKLGNIQWISVVIKESISSNIHDDIGSFGFVMTEDNLVLLFNDNKRNYDNNGIYNGNDFKGLLKKSNYVLAAAQLELNSGEVKRIKLHECHEIEGYVVPNMTRQFAKDFNSIITIKQSVSNDVIRFGVLRK